MLELAQAFAVASLGVFVLTVCWLVVFIARQDDAEEEKKG